MEEEEDRSCLTPEQCFYASFKIYLSDSRKNSVCESEGSDSVHSGPGEVVRIEKTMEVSDDSIQDNEEDKTLSNSREFLDDYPKDDTDVEYDEIEAETVNQKSSRPTLIITDPERKLKRSLSESDESPSNFEQMPRRNSRSSVKGISNRQYEVTQSMDRCNSERSPVFYLDPLDWIRTEGSSPLPIKEKSPSKLLESFQGGAKNNLDILTESEENLNSEIQKINDNKVTDTEVPGIRENQSLPNFRFQTPTIELTREDNSTPDQGYSSTLSFRSITPGVSLLDKTRRTTFPLLCSRPGSACDKMILGVDGAVAHRKVSGMSRKSCEDILQPRKLSSDDMRSSSSSLHQLAGIPSVLLNVGFFLMILFPL